jgi:hypothetical protein
MQAERGMARSEVSMNMRRQRVNASRRGSGAQSAKAPKATAPRRARTEKLLVAALKNVSDRVCG